MTNPTYRRADGATLCEMCGQTYKSHNWAVLVTVDGPVETVVVSELCNGELVETSPLPIDFRRASGSSICETCGKEYRKHPLGGPIGYTGEQFLNELCNGELVKL